MESQPELAARRVESAGCSVYHTDESGEIEVEVRDFPRGDRKWVISSEAGLVPCGRVMGRSCSTDKEST